MRIGGLLESASGASFVGHRVRLEFQEQVAVEGMVPATVRPGSRTALLSADGEFALELPDASAMRPPYALSIVAPDGTVLRREALAEIPTSFRGQLEPAEATTLVVHPDPLKGGRARLTGRLLDRVGPQAGRSIRILATRVGDPPDATPELVLDARSTADGYFTGEYPRGRFASAFARVEGHDEPIALRLTDGALPRRLPLVIDELLRGDDDVEATTDDIPPRAPDPEDLAMGGGSFSQDLGVGCLGLSSANRVLEEFDYFRVVRTTDPVLYKPSAGDRVLARALVRRTVPTALLAGNIDLTGDGDTASVARPIVDASTALTLTRSAAGNAALTRVRRALGDVIHPDGRTQIDSDHPVDWDGPADLRQAATIAHGHLLHFRQIWRADGYSLGDLLYSLPLAPCQQKQIAVVDWERRQVGDRAEDVTVTEQVRAALARDRDINEIVGTSLGEAQAGSSEARTDAASGGFSIFGLASAAWSSGSASSAARQSSARELTAASMQELHDRISQAASAVRSQRGTVVQSVVEGETVTAQTEVVANYNHCHTLTIEYFEVLRHFLVTHDLIEVRECLLVPLIMELFDADKARRWQDPLRRLLRDRDLAPAFSALERLARSGRTVSHADEAVESIQGAMRIRLNIARPRGPRGDETFGQWNGAVWSAFARLSPAAARVIYDQLVSAEGLVEEVWQEQYAPAIARAYISGLRFVAIDRTGAERPLGLSASILRYSPRRNHLVRVNAGQRPGLTRRDIGAVVLRSSVPLPPDSLAAITVVDLDYQTPSTTLPLVQRRSLLDDLSIGDDVYLAAPPQAEDLADPRARDERLRDRLLDHLNDHLEYYHRLLWQRIDPARRYLMLDGFRAPDGSGRSLASVVENRVIGVVGNSLVFPVVPGVRLDPTFRPDPEGMASLLDLYAPIQPDRGFRVTVPTRGVFAEGVMGECNTCEEKDESRFWRFEESPCPGTPAAIAPVSTDSRSSGTPDLRPGSLPNPIVNIQNAPAAPDPAGLSAALRVISTPNLFADLTGLTQNQRNALASLQETAREAQNILATNNRFVIDALRILRAGRGGGSDGSDRVARQQTATRNLDKTMAAIRGAMRNGLISRSQASRLAATSLRQAVGEEETTPRATQEPAIRDLLTAAAARPQSTVTVVRPDESVAISQGGEPLTEMEVDDPFALDDPDDVGDFEPAALGTLAPGSGLATQISSTLDAWLRSAANDVAFFNGADATSYFVETTGQGFPGWFRDNCGRRGAWSARQLAAGPDIDTRLEQIWDRVLLMIGEDSANLLQYVCLTSVFINETGSRLLPVTEIGGRGRAGHVGLAYLFDSIPGIKRSYNGGSNRTAFNLFNDADFIDAHGALALGPQLAGTTDRRWAGTQFPAGIDTSEDINRTGFVQQADFYKFRGRGLIQTTGRGNYLDVVRAIQRYGGSNATITRYRDAWRGLSADTAATRSRNDDWNELFQRTDFELPCLAVGLHNQRGGSYMSLANDLATLNGQGAGSVYNVGQRVNPTRTGSKARLFRRRVIQILETLMITPLPTRDPMTDMTPPSGSAPVPPADPMP